VRARSLELLAELHVVNPFRQIGLADHAISLWPSITWCRRSPVCDAKATTYPSSESFVYRMPLSRFTGMQTADGKARPVAASPDPV